MADDIDGGIDKRNNPTLAERYKRFIPPQVYIYLLTFLLTYFIAYAI